MKRAKRDKTERAYKLGYNQGLKGHAKERCPYHETEKRGLWMGGWRQGHAFYVAGYRMPSEMWAVGGS
ncbi:MAG: ribosome modulation factor [Gammaproteobacteria bacterium]|jgi:ribosome modulation factor|nr:ribosome modulation factor [Gammaproteobacteria bacterium]